MSAERSRDMRSLWRIMLAVILPLGPLGVMIVRGVMPYWTDQSPSTIASEVAAAPNRADVMVWAFGLTYPALVVGPLVIGYLARRRAPRLSTWGAILAFLGFLMAGQIGASDQLMATLAADGYDAPAIADISESFAGHPIGGIGLGVFVLGHILGTVLLGLALLRARLVPSWAAITLAASQPFHLIAAVVVPSRMLDLTLGWGFTLVGYLAVSVALLRMADAEFDSTGLESATGPARIPTAAA